MLSLIKQFGYLRNKELAALCFCGDVRKAQRATQAAVQAGELVERKLPTGSRFALPQNAALLDTITGHRDAANSVLIGALNAGKCSSVIPDRQIQLNQGGYTCCDKLPDGLALDDYVDSNDINRTDYTWLEIENSERSGRDVALLGDWIMQLFMSTKNWYVLPEYRQGYIGNVLIVKSAAAADKIEQRLMGYIDRTYTAESEQEFIRDVLPWRLTFKAIKL